MKTIASLLMVALAVSGCSRARDEAGEPTPRPNLRADAERLQSAINKAAEQRKQQGSPTPAASAP